MAYKLIWLADVLRAAELKVEEVAGWQSRGRGDMGEIKGVLLHHTAGPKAGNMPSLNIVQKGRTDLPGPLAQLGLGRDGTYYVIAAGKCSHAGGGKWRDITTGNTNFIGIEAENTGLANDSPWPDVQMMAYRQGVAAIIRHLGLSVDDIAGHKEYALPKGRKSDPSFDMDSFRASVAAILGYPAPRTESTQPLAHERPTLSRGATGEAVKQIQAKIGIAVDGDFGPRTEAAVRAFQISNGLTPDGIVGPETWQTLERN